ncbi:hypothetical protein HDV57DRAFT_371114 [Trichoderma longibrachiatum]
MRPSRPMVEFDAGTSTNQKQIVIHVDFICKQTNCCSWLKLEVDCQPTTILDFLHPSFNFSPIHITATLCHCFSTTSPATWSRFAETYDPTPLSRNLAISLRSTTQHYRQQTHSILRPQSSKPTNSRAFPPSRPSQPPVTMATTTTQPKLVDAILNHSAPPYTFRFSPFLRQTYQVGLPADRPICKAFQAGSCPNGTRCAERHVSEGRPTRGDGGHGQHHQQPTGGLNSLVCKHWLRGLCKKGEHCEFLHEYNLRKMPECNFFMRNGYCSNGEECLYLHVDPLSKLPPCPHYDMGFCPLGPVCSKKHVRRKLCVFYLAGFCPDGPECKVGAHPKWSKDLEKPVAKSADKSEEEIKMEMQQLQMQHQQQQQQHQYGRDDDGDRWNRKI